MFSVELVIWSWFSTSSYSRNAIQIKMNLYISGRYPQQDGSRMSYQILSFNNDTVLGSDDTLDGSSLAFIFPANYHHLIKPHKHNTKWKQTSEQTEEEGEWTESALTLSPRSIFQCLISFSAAFQPIAPILLEENPKIKKSISHFHIPNCRNQRKMESMNNSNRRYWNMQGRFRGCSN